MNENICPGYPVTPEELAEFFHAQYEELAPHFGYMTRKETAVSWRNVPQSNYALMVAVSQLVLEKWFPQHLKSKDTPE